MDSTFLTIKAETIAKALGGRKVRDGWIAHCPTHDDRKPSLSVCDTDSGKVLVHCHAGCEQARVIGSLEARGLWPSKRRRQLRQSAPPGAAASGRIVRDDHERKKAALAIWHSSTPASCGSLVGTYLATRGLQLPPSSTLRLHVGLKHPSGGIWPAMIALVTNGRDDAPVAIHRTFLARDGRGKAPVTPQKMMLGRCRGGAVRLAAPGDALMIGEGLETCLAAMMATGRSTWAALSTAGLRTLDLPNDVCDVIVLADGDDPGEAAARDCAWRWKREGRRVRIARPPRGMDFNDLLISGAPSIEETGP